MTTFPGLPLIIKGGTLLIDQETSVVWRIISPHYYPDMFVL